jgi:hypothetical protein
MNNMDKAKQKLYEDYPNKELTKKLDKLHLDVSNVKLSDLYEIVLWKLNRFIDFEKTIDSLKELGLINDSSCDKSKEIITELLESKGIGLPMASTILRFLNPKVYQIIDDRVYRFLYSGENDKNKWNNNKPRYESAPIDEKIKIYCDYLRDLKKASDENNIDFFDADRVFYFYDIFEKNKVGKGPSPQESTKSKNPLFESSFDLSIE